MIRKLVAGFALAIVATFAAPLAANATYVPSGQCVVSPSTLKAGETGTLECGPGTYGNSESVSFVVEGESGVNATLASFRATASAASLVKQALADGSSTLSVTVPADAKGAYTITGTGQTSDSVATAALTVIPVDYATATEADPSATATESSSAVVNSGFNVGPLLIWIAGAILALGLLALLLLLAMRRRHHAAHSAE